MLLPLKSLTKTLLIGIALICSSVNVYASEPLKEFNQAMIENKGKVVYLDFWASWCVPCRKSFPWMNMMQTKYKEQGLVVLSVNLDAQENLAAQFLAEVPANFGIIYDAKGILAQKFQLKGMPSSYVFNREGKLISAHSGFNGEKQLQYQQELIEALNN